jgi:DNA repair exonuclease SbcCD nuclease subunit
MKIAKIGDMHFANSNGSIIHQKNIKKFCDNVLFPELEKRKIKTVLQTGDIFTSRTSTHSQSLDNAKECFFDRLSAAGIELHLILGNHDIFFKHSLQINTPELVLAEYDNITIYKSPTTVRFGDIKVDMLSWICDENQDETLRHILQTDAEYCFAHLELAGFRMSKSHIAEHGMDANIFQKYKQVWSGHYHSQSKSGNVHYLGNPTQDTWESVDEIKGFHIFDTETLESEFIENPYNLFERIVYNEDLPIKLVEVTDKFVKVVVDKATDTKKLEKYIEALWKQNPNDIKVIENMVVNESVDTNITLEQLDSGGFQIVPFLIDYTLQKHESLNNTQKAIIEETYKKLYDMNNEVA